MIVAPPRRPKSTEERILPLINIVFLLLIFFMLAGVFATRPPFALTPPGSQSLPHRTQLTERVLSVGAQGQLALGGQTLDQAQLAAALAGWPKDKPLQIRADGRLQSGALEALFATLRDAGIGEIELLTRHQNP